MPTRKIKDLPFKEICKHPDHNPPTMIVYDPGEWEHICPACGKKTKFIIYPKNVCYSLDGDNRDYKMKLDASTGDSMLSFDAKCKNRLDTLFSTPNSQVT